MHKGKNSNSNLIQSLNHILRYVRILTKSDAGTIYLKEDNSLKFTVFQNDSVGQEQFLSNNIDINSISIPLDSSENKLVAVSSFIDMKMINIKDVYSDTKYNLYGTKLFDKLFGYETHSVLTVPLIHPFSNFPIGVLQLINKKNSNEEISWFVKEDEELVNFMSPFVSMSILNVQNYIDDLKTSNQILQEKLDLEMSRNLESNSHIYNSYKKQEIEKIFEILSFQYKEPLNRLGLNGIYLYEVIKDEKQKQIAEENNKIIQELSSIFNCFESVFVAVDTPCSFSPKVMVEKLLRLIPEYLFSNQIELTLDVKDEVLIYGSQNYFLQIMLGIVQNLVDKFVVNNTRGRKLNFELHKENSNLVVEIFSNIPFDSKSKEELKYDNLKKNSKLTSSLNILQVLLEENFNGVMQIKQELKHYNIVLNIPVME